MVFGPVGAAGITGPTALTASADSTIVLWDLETGARVRTFTGHIGSVTDVAVHPDGTWIAFTRTEPRGPDDSPGSARSVLNMLGASFNEHEIARGVGGVSWSPDGASITFLERREGDVGRQLYALPIGSDEATRVFVAERGIRSYRWRPDGGAVAFTVADPTPPQRAAAAVRAWPKKEFARELSRYTLTDLMAFPGRLLAADRCLKSRRLDPLAVMESLVRDLIAPPAIGTGR